MRYVISMFFIFLSSNVYTAEPVEPIVWPTDWPLAVLGTLPDKAYPDLAYETRIGVVGGQFPYQYTLPNSKGLVVDKNTGEVIWTPSADQVGTHNFDAVITDSKNTTINYSFSINVTLNGFLFVDAVKGANNPDNGSIDSPFQSLKYAVSRSESDDFIYMREGNYIEGGVRFSASSSTIIQAYPQEAPNIDISDDSWTYTNNVKLGVFKGLKLSNCAPKCVWIETSADLLFYDNTFDDALDKCADDVRKNCNPSFIFFTGHNKPEARHSMVRVLDNKFSNFTNTGSVTDGATVAFDVFDSLFANNILTNMGNFGFYDKDNSKRNVYRENFITGANSGAIAILGQDGTTEVAVHHNLIIGNDRGVSICGNGPCTKLYIHHNTFYNTSSAYFDFAFTSNGVGPTVHIANNLIVIPDGSSIFPYRYRADTVRDGAINVILGDDIRFNNNLISFAEDPVLGTKQTYAGRNYSKNEWQTIFFKDVNSIFVDPQLTGSGQQLGLSSSSPYFGVYGHQLPSTTQNSVPRPPTNVSITTQ